MTAYKHTHIGYLMLVVTLAVLVFFARAQITARAEPPSVDSGTNLLVTSVMALILLMLSYATYKAFKWNNIKARFEKKK